MASEWLLLENPNALVASDTKNPYVLYPLLQGSGCNHLGRAILFGNEWSVYAKEFSGKRSDYESIQKVFCVDKTKLLSCTVRQPMGTVMPESAVLREMTEIIERFDSAWYTLGLEKPRGEKKKSGGTLEMITGIGLCSASLPLALHTPYTGLSLSALLITGMAVATVGAIRQQRARVARKHLKNIVPVTQSSDGKRHYENFLVGKYALGALLQTHFEHVEKEQRTKEGNPSVLQHGYYGDISSLEDFFADETDGEPIN